MWLTSFGALFLMNLLVPLFSEPLPEEKMNAIQLIENLGYPAESHSVTTKDGFILGLQRIPHGIHEATPAPAVRPVVLLQHGLGACSTNWLSNLANESLAYILADAGFDVWLGNSRGNTYSQHHIDLSPDDWKFWDFTFEDMAAYDVPAMVDHILAVTKQEQLFYVGHSQGTMIGFAKFSSDPELAKKIKVFFALAPVSTVGHITSPLRDIAPFTTEIWEFSPFAFVTQDAAKILGIDATGDLTWILKYTSPVCDIAAVNEILCKNVLFFILGSENPKNLNVTRLPVYNAHNPAGTSSKNIAHFGQLINSEKFGMFDYGWFGNWEHYKQFSPPQYDINNMEVDTELYWSNTDALADPMDVIGLLPKIKNKHSTMINDYSHIDFIWAMNARKLIYEPMIKVMKNGFVPSN